MGRLWQIRILMAETRSVTITPADELTQFKNRSPRKTFSRKDSQNIFKSISPATAGRALPAALKPGSWSESGTNELRFTVF